MDRNGQIQKKTDKNGEKKNTLLKKTELERNGINPPRGQCNENPSYKRPLIS